MTSWPISTPTLKDTSDQASASRGRPNSFSTEANPKPWMRPKKPAKSGRASRAGARAPRPAPAVAGNHEQIVGADDHDRERDERLDDPCRRAEDVERRQRQRDAVPDRERRDDQRQAPERAAEEQQADQEQDVVRADQDVLDARRDERPDHRPSALRRPGEEPHAMGASAVRMLCWRSAPSS